MLAVTLDAGERHLPLDIGCGWASRLERLLLQPVVCLLGKLGLFLELLVEFFNYIILIVVKQR